MHAINNKQQRIQQRIHQSRQAWQLVSIFIYLRQQVILIINCFDCVLFNSKVATSVS